MSANTILDQIKFHIGKHRSDCDQFVADIRAGKTTNEERVRRCKALADHAHELAELSEQLKVEMKEEGII